MDAPCRMYMTAAVSGLMTRENFSHSLGCEYT
jgi:hypothetical protein